MYYGYTAVHPCTSTVIHSSNTAISHACSIAVIHVSCRPGLTIGDLQGGGLGGEAPQLSTGVGGRRPLNHPMAYDLLSRLVKKGKFVSDLLCP